MQKKYRLISMALCMLITLPSLQGCILLAAGAGAATTAVVANDRRSIQTMSDDQNIELTANTQTHQNPVFSNSHIVIVSFNHAVLLAGQVFSQEIRRKVETMVQGLPKVTRIYNQLEIAPPTSGVVRSDDSLITTEVKAKMVMAKDLHASQIKVITENGSVYLLGIVNHHQADLAADVARRAPGVKRVVTLFEYTMD